MLLILMNSESVGTRSNRLTSVHQETDRQNGVSVCRRQASGKLAGNSHAENASNTYHMPSRETTFTPYETVQLEAGAPAQSTNTPTPAPRFVQHDLTLVDNDLYQ